MTEVDLKVCLFISVFEDVLFSSNSTQHASCWGLFLEHGHDKHSHPSQMVPFLDINLTQTNNNNTNSDNNNNKIMEYLSKFIQK